jgi:glycosyltransferase involved in cell wall biosynthesis
MNIFYEEPDPDRWIPLDRYPRRIVRRLVRGKLKWGGVMQVAINLMKGLDKLGVEYRFNDYKHIRKHPDEIACIVGKPDVLFDNKWPNPIIFGSGIYSHSIEYPDLLQRYPNIKRVLVPGGWMREMFIPDYGDKVLAWPTGIDTEAWSPENVRGSKQVDFLIYDKVRWEHPRFEKELIKPITSILDKHRLSYQFILYGSYDHDELTEKLKKAKAVIFLCEHETQGFAYQQILSTNTPILAWDRGGYWQDPYYYPDRVKFQPVSSVPYWDERCGWKFMGAGDFENNLEEFLSRASTFKPRDYILENLTLEKCAEEYLRIYNEVQKELL